MTCKATVYALEEKQEGNVVNFKMNVIPSGLNAVASCSAVTAGVYYDDGPSDYITVNGTKVDKNVAFTHTVDCNSCNPVIGSILEGEIKFPEDGSYTIYYIAGYPVDGGMITTDKMIYTYQVGTQASSSTIIPSNTSSTGTNKPLPLKNIVIPVVIASGIAGAVGIVLHELKKNR